MAQAIKFAQEAYQSDFPDYQNTCVIAIFHLTAGNISQSKHLYQNALANKPIAEPIKYAIGNLKDLLTVLPNFPNAENLRNYLQAALLKETNDLN